MRIRFIHAADLHLDSPFRGLADVPRAIREVIKEATFGALERLVALALSERAQFVVIAGDVYDLEDRSVRAQLRFHEAMERLAAAGVSVFIAHGNHDPLDGKRMAWPAVERIHTFGGERVETHTVYNESGQELAHVHGISFPSSSVTDNLAARFRVRNASVLNVAVLHTNVDGDADHDNYAPCTRAQLARAGMDYWALGHIHKRRILQEEPLIVYAGNIQGRSVKETGAKGCYLVEAETDRTHGNNLTASFLPLDTVRWLNESLSVQGAGDEQALRTAVEHKLETLREAAEDRPVVVRLTLVGRSELHAALSRTSLAEDLIGVWNREQAMETERDAAYPFVWVESCRVRTSGAVDKAALAAQTSFLGDLLRLTDELRQDRAALASFVREVAVELIESKTWRYLVGDDGSSGSGALGEATAAADEDLREQLQQAEDWVLDMLIEGGGR